MPSKKINLLAIALISTLITGMLGSIVTYPSIASWYAGLNKPLFNPPNWVFGPVWTTLYILMGVALYEVLQRGWNKKKVRAATFVFAIQLMLNFCWSFLFFSLKNPAAAFWELLVLWVVVVISIYYFWRVSRLAAILLVPYILWITFAAFLNYFIVRLN